MPSRDKVFTDLVVEFQARPGVLCPIFFGFGRPATAWPGS